MKLAEIAEALSATVEGDANLEIVRPVHPADAEGPEDLAVAVGFRALQALPGTRARAALVASGKEVEDEGLTLVRYGGHERVAMAVLTSLFANAPVCDSSRHPTAAIADGVNLSSGSTVGANAVIGEGTTVGAGTAILPNVSIGRGVSIGAGCVIHPGTAIGDRVVIGDRVTIQANAVIGSDGFSYIPAQPPKDDNPGMPAPMRVHSLGSVVIGDDVEIGACATIDRGTLRNTVVGANTKIDNLVQIAHNAVIGESCLICGMVGIAGSANIGDRVVIAAGSGVSDHCHIGADATVAAMSGVAALIDPGILVSGTPALPHEVSVERYANVAKLKKLYPKVSELAETVKALERRVEELGHENETE